MSSSSDSSNFRQVITADPSPFEAGWKRATAAAKSGSEGIDRAVDAMRVGIAAAFAGVGAVMLGVAKQTVNVQDEFSKAAQKAGVTTEQFSGMAYAAKLADIDIESLTKAYSKLNGTLVDGQQGQKQAVELFRRLKLDPTQIKDADQFLLLLADRFAGMNNGAEKASLAIDVFGERIGPKLVPFLNAGRAGIEDLRAEAAKFGVVVSTAAGQAAEEFNDTLTRIQARTQGVAQKLTNALLPTLQNVATAMLEVDKDGKVVDTMAKGLRVTFEAVTIVGANVSFVFAGVGREIGAILAQLGLVYDVLRAPPDQIISAAKRAWSGWTAISDAVKADGVAARKVLDDFERRVLGLSPKEGPVAAHDKPKPPPWSPLAKRGDTKTKTGEADKVSEPSFMAYYQAALEEEKLAAARTDALRDYSAEQEKAYWQNLLDFAQLGGKDRIDISRRVSRLEVDMLRDTAKQGQQIQADRLRAKEAAALDGVAAAQMEAQAAYDTEEITLLQLLQLETQHEQQRAEIRRSALQAQLAMLDPVRDPVAFERISLEIEAAERAHLMRLRELRLAEAAAQAEPLRNVMQAVQAGIGQMGDALLSKWSNLAGTLRSIFANIGRSLIQELVIKPLAARVAGFAKERLLTLFGIGADAAKAGSGAAAAVASVPVIGPVLALAALGAVFSAVSGLSNKVPSASQGYDIPSGVNPLTQLHQREMVLPAKYADVIRGMQEGSGGGGAGGAAPAPIELRTIGGVGEFLMVHRHDLAKVIDRVNKDRLRR